MDPIDESPAPHGGPIHAVATKKELAIHLGVPHVHGDRQHRVVHPSAAYLSRWRIDELLAEHRRLHEPPEEQP